MVRFKLWSCWAKSFVGCFGFREAPALLLTQLLAWLLGANSASIMEMQVRPRSPALRGAPGLVAAQVFSKFQPGAYLVPVVQSPWITGQLELPGKDFKKLSKVVWHVLSVTQANACVSNNINLCVFSFWLFSLLLIEFISAGWFLLQNTSLF